MQALRRTLGFASQATARRPRVVVLGSGWGGNKVARYLDKSKFDVRVVSRRTIFCSRRCCRRRPSARSNSEPSKNQFEQ